MEIKDARSLPSIAQEDLRQKAIKAVMDGKKQVEIAEILNVTRQAVGKWVSKFRTEGEEALKAKRKGRPEGGKLLPWQAARRKSVQWLPKNSKSTMLTAGLSLMSPRG